MLSRASFCPGIRKVTVSMVMAGTGWPFRITG
jgi:hypothetical protein